MQGEQAGAKAFQKQLEDTRESGQRANGVKGGTGNEMIIFPSRPRR